MFSFLLLALSALNVASSIDDSTNIAINQFKTYHSSGYTLIVAIGGSGSSNRNEVDIIDTTNSGKTCSTVLPHPEEVSFATGTFYNDRVYVCGGSDGVTRAECFSLGEEHLWLPSEPMPQVRNFLSSSNIGGRQKLEEAIQYILTLHL